jgi:hypothetical protein
MNEPEREESGEKLGWSAMRPPARCPMCGYPLELVWVHGHGQCARCGTNVQSCCEGAPLPTGEQPERDDRSQGEPNDES